MLKQLMMGSSWIVLRSPDNEDGATPPHVPAEGDPHTDDVLEGGPADPPEPKTPEAGEAPPEPETPPAPPVGDEPITEIKPGGKKPKSEWDWKDRDRDRLRGRIRDETAEKERLAAENKRLTDLTESLARQQPPESAEGEQPPPAPRQPPQGRVYTQAELDAEADRRANIKLEQTVFQRDFASAVENANKAFGKDKMNDAIARISELGGLDVDHLNLVLGTDDPGKVLFELGSKPEEFQRIMDLPFNKRVVEFAKMGLKPETPARQPSRTPPPVEPLGGGGGSTDNRYNDKTDDAAWFAAEEKRTAQEYERRKKSRGY